MRRVKDRERKWLARKTKAGRMKRRLEYLAAARKATPVARGEPRFSAIRRGLGRRPDKNCGRRLWAGRAVERTFPAILGSCRS